MGFDLSSPGSFKTEGWLKRMTKQDPYSRLDELAREGVRALSSATPVRTGASANSWYYEIVRKNGSVVIEWRNDDYAGNSSVPVVVLLQYGHGTGTGGYVQGQDFINPAIKPIMDKIASNVWKVVTS